MMSWTVAVLLIVHRCESLSLMRNTPTSGTQYVPLINKGTHSEIEIHVGTPGQMFSVVADTGSNNVIVPSCTCQARSQACTKGDRCFLGTNKSSTFELMKTGTETDAVDPKAPRMTTISFGSGNVEAVMANDVVNVKGSDIKCKTQGVLLMTDNQLNMEHFEGILGMGVPGSNQVMDKQAKEAQYAQGQASASGSGGFGSDASAQDIIDQIMGGSGAGGGSGGFGGSALELPPKGHSQQKQRHAGPGPGDELIDEILKILGKRRIRKQRRNQAAPAAKASNHDSAANSSSADSSGASSKADAPAAGGFFEQAGTAHFSMCFNEGKDGYVGLSQEMPTDHAAASLKGYGTAHWGVGLNGLSVGGTATKPKTQLAGICDQKPNGQATGCGAIPDSGTTLITAPTELLTPLLEGLCDAWPRCVDNHTKFLQAGKAAIDAATHVYGANPFQIDTNVSKSEMLKFILADCKSWMSTGHNSLADLPPLHFNLAGAEGKEQTVTIPGNMWIIEQNAADVQGAMGGDGSSGQPQHITYLESAFMKEGMDDGDKAKLWALARGADKVCSPAFEAMDMPMTTNGPVWILGTPLFYEYQVGFGMKSTPPTVSFISTKQKPCNGNGKAAQTSSQVPTGGITVGTGASLVESDKPVRPLQIQGPWRRPTFSELGL